MKYNHIASYLTLTLGMSLMTSCSTSLSNTDTENVDIPTVTFGPLGSDQTLTDAFSKVRFLQLELTDDCTIGEIKNIIDADNTLVVYTRNEEVFTFDKESGKFICQIGAIGEGPDEYLTATGIYYDKKNNSINVLDRLKKVIISYSTSGLFIENKKIEAPIENADNIVASDNGNLMLSSSLCDGDPVSEYAYTLINPDGTYSNLDPFSPIYVKGYQTSFAMRPMASTGDRIVFFKLLNDTIFSMEKGHISPVYKLSMKKQMPRKDVVAQIEPFAPSVLLKMSASGEYISGFNKIFETERYIVLEPWSKDDGIFWIDKKTENGIRIPFSNHMNPVFDLIIQGKSINYIVGSNENELISAFTADFRDKLFLREMNDYPEIKPFSPDLKPFWESVDPDGNPCLIIYEH